MFYCDVDSVCSLPEIEMIVREDKLYGDLVNLDVLPEKVNGNTVVRVSSLFDKAVINACKRLGFLEVLKFMKKEEDNG